MKFGIRTKMLGSLGLITAVFILCLIVVSLVIRNLTITIHQMQQIERKVVLTDRLQLYLNKLKEPAQEYLITGSVSERDEFDQLVNKISEIIKELQKYQGDDNWTTLVAGINQETLKLSEMLITVLFIEDPVGNAHAYNLIREASMYSDSLIDKVDEFHNFTQQEMSSVNQAVMSKSLRAQYISFGAIGSAIVFLGLFSFYIPRFIIRPILSLHHGAQIVASGNLNYRLSVMTRDEIGNLALEFNRMIQALSDMKKDLDLKLEETHMLAITDPLTGLHNYRFFMEKITEEVNRAERYNRPLSIITMDIDNFKSYNDTHGHLRGDDLLRIFGSVIKQQTRITNFPCRTGGEEFTVILPETEKNEAVQLAERLRIAIENHPFPYKETQPNGNLTISLGVASYVKGEMDLRSLIKMADDALYLAKRLGKNHVATLT
jgi:diguanylate cyclase (GGDEF)-like protein